MLIFKVIGIAILTTIISIILLKQKPEFSMLVSIAGGIIIFILIVQEISGIFDWMNSISDKVELSSEIIKPLIKIIGIGYITEFASTICEDSGNKSMSNHIILSGKIIIIAFCIPIFKSLLESIVSIL